MFTRLIMWRKKYKPPEGMILVDEKRFRRIIKHLLGDSLETNETLEERLIEASILDEDESLLDFMVFAGFEDDHIDLAKTPWDLLIAWVDRVNFITGRPPQRVEVTKDIWDQIRDHVKDGELYPFIAVRVTGRMEVRRVPVTQSLDGLLRIVP